MDLKIKKEFIYYKLAMCYFLFFLEYFLLWPGLFTVRVAHYPDRTPLLLGVRATLAVDPLLSHGPMSSCRRAGLHPGVGFES
jgi:hypothetical protein